MIHILIELLREILNKEYTPTLGDVNYLEWLLGQCVLPKTNEDNKEALKVELNKLMDSVKAIWHLTHPIKPLTEKQENNEHTNI